MRVEIHSFCLSEVSSPRFSRFTLKVRAVRTDVMESVARGESPVLETGRNPGLLPALEAGSLSGRSYCKVLGDLQKRNYGQCRTVCLFIVIDGAPWSAFVPSGVGVGNQKYVL